MTPQEFFESQQRQWRLAKLMNISPHLSDERKIDRATSTRVGEPLCAHGGGCRAAVRCSHPSSRAVAVAGHGLLVLPLRGAIPVNGLV